MKKRLCIFLALLLICAFALSACAPQAAAQALAAATINSARAIGRDAFIGSLEPGKQADLLVLSVEDYRHLAYRFGGNLVDAVIKKGKIVYR